MTLFGHNQNCVSTKIGFSPDKIVFSPDKIVFFSPDRTGFFMNSAGLRKCGR